MKLKLNILFCLLFQSFTWSQQQDTAMPKINGGAVFGIKGGITQSDYYGPDINTYFASSKTTPVLGFHVGVNVNTEISDCFWLKHELIITQKGAGVSVNDSINGTYTTKLKTYSLDLFPISFSYHKKGFQVFAGPFASMVFAGNIIRKDEHGKLFKDKTIYGDSRQFEDTSKYLQKLDYGLNIGLEYEFKNGLTIGARYVRGRAEVLDYANKNTLHDRVNKYRIYNHYFNISIGYCFRRKPK